jgi:heme-degrading monooxygenase HmoA
LIARTWRGWIATERSNEYVAYLDKTGLSEYADTRGNLGAHCLTRDLDDGRTEIVTLSFWESMDAVKRFAGDDPSQAVFYPEDDDFLVDRETTVTHFQVPWSTQLPES